MSEPSPSPSFITRAISGVGGRISTNRLVMLWVMFVLVPGFLIACAFWKDLREFATHVFLLAGGALGLKGNEDHQKRKLEEAKVEKECAPTDDPPTPSEPAPAPEANRLEAPAEPAPSVEVPPVLMDRDHKLGLVAETGEPEGDDVDEIPPEAIKLILAEEGMDQPYLWPGENSGITLGRGYDLGYEPHFASDWSGVIPDPWIRQLMFAVGLKGLAAKAEAPHFRGIKITREQADQVFHRVTVPNEIRTTRKAFPGYDALPAACRGALVSLVFNRGAGMDSSNRRLEMRQIRAAIVAGELAKVPALFRSMKRLWPKGSGLIGRRENEAKLWESGLV